MFDGRSLMEFTSFIFGGLVHNECKQLIATNELIEVQTKAIDNEQRYNDTRRSSISERQVSE
jgi:hypothetical protein